MFTPTVTISLEEYECLKLSELEIKRLIEQIRGCYIAEWSDKRECYLSVDSTKILNLLKSTVVEFMAKDCVSGFVIKEKEE